MVRVTIIACLSSSDMVDKVRNCDACLCAYVSKIPPSKVQEKFNRLRGVGCDNPGELSLLLNLVTGNSYTMPTRAVWLSPSGSALVLRQ